jgi:NAD(P)-dependent dehydrogenase (short-subunit alcohol dehydrogenase family)
VSLRPGLLAGRRVALAGDESAAVGERLRALGAELAILPGSARADEAAAAAWVAAASPLRALVYDARGAFASGGHERLRAVLDEAWICARAVATGALIGSASDGRLLFLTPAPGSGSLAEAARAGLESLARTLSVEWARHTVTAVAVCPGEASGEADIADLIAFLLGAGGGYYSGCRFDLGLVAAAPS